MNAEIVGGQLWILPSTIKEAQALIRFGQETKPEELVHRLVLSVDTHLRTIYNPPPEEARVEETTAAPTHIKEAVNERDALVAEAKALGASDEDVKGKREKGLSELIEKLKATNAEVMPTPEEKPAANALVEAAKPSGAIPAPTYEQAMNLGREYISSADEADRQAAKVAVKACVPAGKNALAECGPEERTEFFKAVEKLMAARTATKTDGGDEF